MRRPILQIISVLLCLVGLGVSALLLVRTFALLDGRAEGALDVCRLVFASGACDATLASDRSYWLDVPLAGWGVTHFGTLLVLLLLGRLLGDSFRRAAAAGAVLLASAGALVSVLLVIALATGDGDACPLCLVTHAASIPLPVVLLLGSGMGLRDLGASVGAAFSWAAGEDAEDAEKGDGDREARWRVLAFAFTALAAVCLYQWVLVETVARRAGTGGGDTLEAALERHDGRPAREIPLRPDDPRKGGADPKATIVLFVSFQCPGCRELAEAMEEIVAAHPEDLAVVFKHFPLGQDCNPSARMDPHPQSCMAAHAAEAARLQDAFWPFHDALFHTDLIAAVGSGAGITRPLGERLGLDVERLVRDVDSETVRTRVAEDIEIGNRLGVDATPGVFVDGRRVEPVILEVIEALVERALGDRR